MSHVSLELVITRDPNGGYVASAMVLSLSPPQRVPIVPVPVPLTLDLATLRSLLGLEQYGATLTEMVFRPPLVRAFGYIQGYQQRGGEPVSLRIVLDPADSELHSIRWELLREPPNGFPLATSEEIVFARTLFSEKVTSHTLSRSGGGVVIAVADPPAMPLPQTLGLDYMELARKGLGQTRQVLLDGRANRKKATLSALDLALADGPEVLYLVCHGAMVSGEPYIYLEQEDAERYKPAPGHKLLELIAQQKRPLLIILLSCNSAGNDYEALTALGPRLAQSGVPAVLAMHGQVPSELVAAFVPRLLRELSQDARVDRAVAAARRALGTRDDSWMPVLWMSIDDPDLKRLGYSIQPSDQEAVLYRSLKSDSPPPIRPFTAPVRLPQSTGPLHVTRPDDLVALGRALASAGSELVSPTVIVTGAAGAGKTQLLLDFAYHYGPLFEGGVYWINCSDDELIEEELVLCARAGLLADGDWTNRDVFTVVGKVQEAWQEPVRRLIIFDECEDEDTLRRLTYRPLLGGCYVLVSSRNTRWKTAPGTIVYSLSPLPEELGVQLLLAHKCGIDRTQARAVVTVLGGMPLAVQLVGSYLALTSSASAWSLLEELQAVSSQSSDATPTPEQSIQLTGLLLERHLEQLQAGDTGAQLAYKLLEHAIVGAPEQSIDRQLLQESLAAGGLVSPAVFVEALAHLVRRGLLVEVGDAPGDQTSFQVHRLTAKLLRSRRGHDLGYSEARVVAALIKKCEETLATSRQVKLFELIQQFRRYLPHLRFLLTQGGTLNEQQRATIHTLLASYHRTCGRNKDAEEAVERALDFHTRGMSHVAEQVVKGYREAAAFAQLQGDVKLELDRLAQAQKIADTAAPESLSVQAEVRYVLAIRTMQAEESNGAPRSEADAKRRQAARERAVKLLTESRDLLAKAGGGKTLLRATILHELGALYFQQENLDLARKNFERALEIRDELRDELTGSESDPRQRWEYHISIAETLHSLGNIERQGSDPSIARAYLERALEIRHQVSTLLDIATIDVITSLMLCFVALGEHEAAADLGERELQAAAKQLAPDHPMVRELRERIRYLIE